MPLSMLYFITGQVIWGLLPIFWKFLSALDPLYLLAARIVWSAFFCGLYLVLSSRWRDSLQLLRNGPLCRRLGLASLFATVNWGLFILAVNTGHIFEAGLSSFINPIVCLAASAAVFGESLNRWQKASAAAALTGLCLSLLLYGTMPWFSLLMCAPFSLYCMLKKGVDLPGTVSVFAESLCMAAPSLLYMVYMECAGQGAAAALHGIEWLLLPMTGIFTALPIALFSAGLRGISFSAAAILMYLTPTLQSLIAPFYGEQLSPFLLLNFGFIGLAVVFYITGALQRRDSLSAAGDNA